MASRNKEKLEERMKRERLGVGKERQGGGGEEEIYEMKPSDK